MHSLCLITGSTTWCSSRNHADMARDCPNPPDDDVDDISERLSSSTKVAARETCGTQRMRRRPGDDHDVKTQQAQRCARISTARSRKQR
jgi:hypothetical protein